MSIEQLHRPSDHLQQRCNAADCTNRQHHNHRLQTRTSSIRKARDTIDGIKNVSLQDMHGELRSGLNAPNLNYELVREYYLDNPVGSSQHLKFSSIVHRHEEEIEFLIDSHEWFIPTGGMTSTGTNVEYNWDIYIDGNFFGNFRGYSGQVSTGIYVKKTPNRRIGPIVFLKDVEEFDNAHPFTTVVPISSPHNYGYLPYWFLIARDGKILDLGIGTHSLLSLERQNSIFRFFYRPSSDTSENTSIIYQCAAIFPIKENVTREDISTYRLEIKPHEAFKTAQSICPPPLPPEIHICPDFVIQYAKTQSLQPCQLPYRFGTARYSKHVPTYTSPHGMQVLIRPRSNYPLEHGWLRGYGFCEDRETREQWNTHANKNKVIGVRAVITPETVCIDCFNTGNFAFRSWFDGCSRLQDVELSYHADWRTVTTAGDMFGYRMFFGCSSLRHVGTRFTEPQSLTTCGDDFNRYKFANCTSLRYVSEEYTEPYRLKETGSAFCANQFSGCRSLTYVSPYYTEPLEIVTDRPDFFNCYKFAGCVFARPSPQYRDSIIQFPGNGHLAHKWAASWT